MTGNRVCFTEIIYFRVFNWGKNAIRYEEGQPYVDRILDDGKLEAIKVDISPYVQGFVKFSSGVEEGFKLKNQTVISNKGGGDF